MSPLCRSAVPSSFSPSARRRVVGIGAILASTAFAGPAEAHPYIGIGAPVRAASSDIQGFSAATHTGSSRVRNVSFYVDGRRVFLDRAARWRVPGGVDTRRLSDGRHRLRARALFRNGATRVAERVITVRNRRPAPDTTAPAAPTGLKATAASGSVSLDWNDSPERDFSYYAVRRSTSADGPWERLPGNHASSEYVDKAVDADRRYHYLVTAMDKSVNVSRGSFTDASTPPGPTLPAPDPTPEPPDPTPGKPVWSSGFEGNLLDSWMWAQTDSGSPLSDRARTVTDTVRSGRQSARLEVRTGDDVGGTVRSQLAAAKKPDGKELRFYEGDDYYFSYSLKLAHDYPMDRERWQQLLGWMRSGGGQGPLKMGTSFESNSFRIEGPDGDKVYWRGPVVKGEWLDFVVRVHFSESPSQGFIEVWYKRPEDGRLVRQTLTNGQDRLHTNTMGVGSTHSYLKMGPYRDPNWTVQPSVIWYDGWKIGHSLEDVAP